MSSNPNNQESPRNLNKNWVFPKSGQFRQLGGNGCGAHMGHPMMKPTTGSGRGALSDPSGVAYSWVVSGLAHQTLDPKTGHVRPLIKFQNF